MLLLLEVAIRSIVLHNPYSYYYCNMVWPAPLVVDSCTLILIFCIAIIMIVKILN